MLNGAICKNRAAASKHPVFSGPPLSRDQKVREIDDQYEITATVVDSAVLDRWLLSFGDEVSMVRRLRLVVAKSMAKPEVEGASVLGLKPACTPKV